MTTATKQDIPRLIELMAEFYAESGYTLDRERAAGGFLALISDPRLGGAWLMEHEGKDAGYIVLTTCFSMEYGGLVGFVDDFFVRPPFRGGGLGKKILSALRERSVDAGLCALFVEVAPDNAAAQKVYRRSGFTETNRQLLGLPLSRPSHLAG